MLELLMKRRSIRKYKPETVSEESLRKIMQAALLSPSSRGRNPWEFIVVQNKETLQE
ncbi:MAG: nitroreductase family protein, partial [Peptococcaceae bacterium]|nr:nitroreductase family protein [Peptococcaceae bacterium]